MAISWVSTFQGAEHIYSIPVDLWVLAHSKKVLSSLWDGAQRSQFCSQMPLHKSQAGVVSVHLRAKCLPKVGKQVEWKAVLLTDILTVFAFKVYVHIKI